MGMQHLAVIGVGLPAKELCETWEEFEEQYGDQWETLQLINPWYDASYKYCQAAVIVHKVEDGSMDLNLHTSHQAVQTAMAKFKQVTGKTGKLFLSTYGY